MRKYVSRSSSSSSVQDPRFEHLLERGQLVGYPAGSDEITGGDIQVLRLLERSWHTKFGYSDSTLLTRGFHVDEDPVFRRKKGWFRCSGSISGWETSCSVLTRKCVVFIGFLPRAPPLAGQVART